MSAAATTDVTTAADPMATPRVHEVLARFDEIPGVITLRVAPVTGPVPPARPAQVGMLGAFGVGEAAISISSRVTDHDWREYTIRRAGRITRALTDLTVGDQLWVRGPFGSVWDLELDGDDVLIAAGGIGLAPLRSAIFALVDQRSRYGRVVLVVGARTADTLLYDHEYERWRRDGVEVVTTVDEPPEDWSGRVGLVPDVVDGVIGELGLDAGRLHAMLCGPDPMMTATADVLVAHGVEPASIQLTVERNMQCGTGRCGHCQVGPVIVCRDGPVVRYPDVAASLRVAER